MPFAPFVASWQVLDHNMNKVDVSVDVLSRVSLPERRVSRSSSRLLVGCMW